LGKNLTKVLYKLINIKIKFSCSDDQILTVLLKPPGRFPVTGFTLFLSKLREWRTSPNKSSNQLSQ